MRILKTDQYERWFDRLKDRMVRARIDARITQCKLAGRPVGDINPVGDGISELRFHFGPGYRVYFAQKADVLMLLLVGGDKGSQKRDIQAAHTLLDELKEEQQW